MNRLLRNLLDKIVALVARRHVITTEPLYRLKARRLGVEYLGLVPRHRLALFQDPITGSSFAVKAGEPVESGVRRVRARFGVGDR